MAFAVRRKPGRDLDGDQPVARRRRERTPGLVLNVH